MTSKKETTTRTAEDGLRYKSKVAGTPFPASASMKSSTMSCYLCGKHRPRAMLQSKRFIGKQQMVCMPSCKEVEAIATKPS